MNYYSHTIKLTNFEYIDTYRLEFILQTGYLLSRRKLKEIVNQSLIDLSEGTALYNGMDYISLCDLSKKHDDYSAFNMYVKNGLSLLFDKKISVITPQLVSRNVLGAYFLGNNEKRFSDLSDEVQVKDQLSLEHLQGLMIPVQQFYQYHNEEYLVLYLNTIKELLKTYHYQVPIINLDSEKEIVVNKKLIKM